MFSLDPPEYDKKALAEQYGEELVTFLDMCFEEV